MGIDLEIGAGALVPRSETELLGRTALELCRGISRPLVIDMCCGTGNLACAIAHARPDASVFASDLTAETVDLASRNAARLGLGNVTVLRGDLFEALAGRGLERNVDLVVCNPPYISTKRLLAESTHLLESEPREAFDGGPYGISIHQRVIRDAANFLRLGGHVAMEFGDGQGRQLALLFGRARDYDQVVFQSDGQVDRVVSARRRTQPT